MSEGTGLAALLAAPVSAAAPGGASVRYEPEFEALKEQIDKLSSPSSAGEIDWGKVADLAREILATKSKDLLVAAYLCAAMLQRQGYGGLAETLEGVQRLVTDLWPALFPEPNRMKARLAALEWLAERLAIAVRQRPAAPAEGPLVERCAVAVDALDAALDGHLSGNGPSFRDLLAALRERAAEVAAPEPEPEPAPAAAPPPATTQPVPVRETPPPSAPAVAPPPALAAGELAGAEGREEALKTTLGNLRTLAGALRRANPHDALACKLARIAAWGRVRGLPPHTDGRTRVPNAGAAPQLAARLEGLAQRGEWGALLEQCETQFAQSVLWLDLQRWSAQALEALGPDAAAARRALMGEFEALVRSFPGLLDLRFDNDMPFASDDTRQWVHQAVLAAPASGTGAAPAVARVAVADGDAAFEDVLAEARERVRENRAGDGIARLQAAIAAATSRRQAFTRRLAAARLLVDLKEARVALALLDALDDDVRAHGLEQWEPALAADVLLLAVQCLRALVRGEWKGAADAQRRLDETFARLARLDPAAALAVKP